MVTRGWPLGGNPKASVDAAAGTEKSQLADPTDHTLRFLHPASTRHPGLLSEGAAADFLFLTLQLPPLRAAKTGRDREEGAFDPAAHEWQKSGAGRRRGSRSEEWRAINLSHEHAPLTSGLATPG